MLKYMSQTPRSEMPGPWQNLNRRSCMSSVPHKVCSVYGCEEKHHARGFCSNHYLIFRRAGAFSGLNLKLCTITDCQSPQVAKGFCDKHYRRMLIHGSLEAARIHGDDETRFFSRVEKTDTCWLWTAFKDWKGYGLFSCAKKIIKAHRYSYKLHKGEIPEGLWVLHKCDNPPCVNPEHLFAGTVQDNVADMVAKGRNSKGETHGTAKLLTSDVLEIRRLYATGEHTQKELGQMFGVSAKAVGGITTRRTWKWC